MPRPTVVIIIAIAAVLIVAAVILVVQASATPSGTCEIGFKRTANGCEQMGG